MVHFKAAQHSDLSILMSYMEEFHYFDHTERFDNISAQAAMVKVLKDATIGRVWLIRQGEETVGYIVLTLAYRLEYRGYYAFLDELYIREDKRGIGIGTKAMAFISRACQNLGIKRLQLEVKQDNPLATALYTKVGFKQQSRDLLTQEIL